MKSAAFASFQSATAPEARIGGEPDDEPKSRRVIIVAEVHEPDNDDPTEVVFRVMCPTRGLSPLYRFPRDSADGNPYSLYGRQAAEWCGVPSWNWLTITVCQTTSGSLMW